MWEHGPPNPQLLPHLNGSTEQQHQGAGHHPPPPLIHLPGGLHPIEGVDGGPLHREPSVHCICPGRLHQANIQVPANSQLVWYNFKPRSLEEMASCRRFAMCALALHSFFIVNFEWGICDDTMMKVRMKGIFMKTKLQKLEDAQCGQGTGWVNSFKTWYHWVKAKQWVRSVTAKSC